MNPTIINPKPDHLLFSIGGFEAFQFEIELVRPGVVRLQTGWPFTEKPAETEIQQQRWDAFWHEVDQIGVWNWKTEYSRMVLDGTSWDLEIAHDGRNLTTYGCNAYPESEGPDGDISYPRGGQFDLFIHAVSRLAGIPVNQIDGHEPE